MSQAIRTEWEMEDQTHTRVYSKTDGDWRWRRQDIVSEKEEATATASVIAREKESREFTERQA